MNLIPGRKYRVNYPLTMLHGHIVIFMYMDSTTIAIVGFNEFSYRQGIHIKYLSPAHKKLIEL